jgi:5-formyltetrahydrofolate cyclo-ligase
MTCWHLRRHGAERRRDRWSRSTCRSAANSILVRCSRRLPRGATGALPVIEKRGKPLLFRAYREGDALEEKRWGIREPLASQPLREPDILLMPMLAFDDAGWRLGYGGGFYDRTLQVLRAKKTVVAIGLAYDEQRLENVVHADYDEPLDCVLTPSGLKRFQRQGKAKA